MTDPYLQPNETLRNRLGIEDADVLQRKEAEGHHLRDQALEQGEPEVIRRIAAASR